jgi:predicted enzyme related to lactoylglutathione lyase
MAVFPYARPGVGGAVIEAGALTPGGYGTLVYLSCDGRLDEVIGRVETAGGRLAGPKVDLPEGMGSFVHVIDPEGNRVGLHGV